jgi:DNA polymerase
MPSITALLDDLSGAPRRAERAPRVDPRPPPSLEEETTRARRPLPVVGLPDPLTISGQPGLDLIREVLGHCQRCKLCHGRNHLVFGQGHPQPLVAFVGEGPGAEEDRTGLPFVGAAGDLLNRMINAMGEEARKRGYDEIAGRLRREQVYICNVVKCRPPGNRTPEQDEVGACGPFLRAQLGALRPKIIVALGRTPTHFLLSTGAPLTRLRGHFASYEGIPVMPTYHPAYLLRTESAKRQAWDDLKMVIEELHRLMIAGAEDIPRERTT